MIMKSKGIATLFMACVLMTPAFNAQAEDFTPEQYTAGEVVVSGTRTEHFIEDVPSTMEVITAEEIKQMGATNVIDVLRSTTGVQTFGVGGGGIQVRGMPDDWSLVLINGRRPTGYGSVGENIGQTIRSVNVNNIERIEILRGSAGAMYGSNTSGGVINIITKKSTEKEVLAGISYGSFGLENYLALDSGKLGNWDFIFNARYQNLEPYREDQRSGTVGDWTESNDGSETNLNLDLGYSLSEDHEVRLFTEFYDRNTFTASDGTARDSRSYTERDRMGGTLEYKGETENHMFAASVSYDQTSSWNYVSGQHRRDNEDIFGRYGIEASDYWAINDTFALNLGGEFFTDTADAEDYPIVDSRNRAALYVVGEISLFDDKLFIVPSLRLDQDSEFGFEATPQLGVTYEFIENHRLKANYGLGYRAPELIELYGVGYGGTGTYRSNPNLEPEESTNWELRYEGGYKNISGALGYFNSEIKKLSELVDTGVPVPGASAGNTFWDRVNLPGTTTIQGIEAELAIDFLTYYTLKGSYTYLKDEEDNGDRLGNRPKHAYKSEFIFNYTPWEFTANVWADVYRDFLRVSRGVGTSYNPFAVHFSMSKGWQDGQYRMFLTLNNIFDTNRTEYTNRYAEDMSYRLGFEMKF